MGTGTKSTNSFLKKWYVAYAQTHAHDTEKKKCCVYYQVCTKRALVIAGFACWNTSHYSHELSFTGLERGLRTGEKTASCPPKASVEAWRKLSARALCPSVSAGEICCSNASILCECVKDVHQFAPCVLHKESNTEAIKSPIPHRQSPKFESGPTLEKSYLTLLSRPTTVPAHTGCMAHHRLTLNIRPSSFSILSVPTLHRHSSFAAKQTHKRLTPVYRPRAAPLQSTPPNHPVSMLS